MIEVEGLTKRFGTFTAVDHVSFTVGKGSIFGFLGPNGSGKTTVIRMLCGILEPTEGTARIGGHDVVRDLEPIKELIGYMSQKFSLYDELTVNENLIFAGKLYGLSGRELNQRRLGNERTNRLRKAEGRGMDGAERRRQHVSTGALRHLGLLRHQRDQILIADRPRYQTHRQNAQAEGSVVANSLRPFTRQHHTHAHATDATRRYATRRNTSVGTGGHCGSNATCSFMVGLTLRRR